MIDKWEELADDNTIGKTIAALKTNGIDAIVVESSKQAKEKVLEIIPQGVELMNMSSTTLDEIGLTEAIMNSGKFNPVRKKLMSMDRKIQSAEMNKLGAAPEWTTGSVHAVTEDGKVLIASNTGSQLSAYAYGSSKIIWVVGTQKIVKNFDDGIKRIYEHSLKLEDARARKAYGTPSGINKLLIFEKEIIPNRIKLIFVKEKLGF